MSEQSIQNPGTSACVPDVARKSRIVELAVKAQCDAKEVKSRAKLCVEMAVECGQLLLKEKEWVRSVYGEGKRGKWSVYYDAQYAGVLPVRTARRWMELGRTYSTNPNSLRLGISAIELLPNKVYPHPSLHAKLGIARSHISLVNRLHAWINRFEKKTNVNDISIEEASRLQAEFAPIIIFLQKICKK